MASIGRRGGRQELNAWPGWVDALSSLIMVVMFLLMVFAVAQFFLAAALNGRDEQLQRLSSRVEELNQLLGLEREANADLRLSMAQVSEELRASVASRDDMTQQLIELQDDRDRLARSAEELEASVKADRETIELKLREAASLQQDLQALREARAKLEVEVAALTRLSEALGTRISEAESRLAETGAGLERTEAERRRLAEQVAAAGEANDALSGERDRLSERLRLTDAQLARLIEELDAQKARAEQAEAKLAEATAGLDAADAERQRLATRLEAAGQSAAALGQERDRLADRLRIGEEQSARQAQALAALGERAAAAERRAAEVADSLQHTSEEARRVAEDARRAAGERDAQRVRADAAESQGRKDAEALRLTEEQKRLLLAELGSVRDRSRALEAALADERDKTILAQKEIDKRDIRLRDLAAAVDAARTSLGSEQQVTQQSRMQIGLLNQQIAALREQLAKLTAALESSEKKADQQQVQIADLGSRLNLALANKVQDLARYRSEFFGRVREALGNRPDVRIVGDRFVFQSELLFPSGSAALEPAGRDRLAQLARTLIEVANRIPGDIEWVLRVDGHTDVRPINTYQFPSNWELSAARAISVAKFLMEQGIPANRLAVAGFAEYQPLDPGSGDEALARNRRIELKLDQK